MARTFRERGRGYEPWSKSEWKEFGRSRTASTLARFNARQKGDANPGFINAPADFKRVLRRRLRAKMATALRNAVDFDAMTLPVFKRRAKYIWF